MTEILELYDAHSGRHRQGQRPWAGVTGITLHQTACEIGERPDPWFNVPVHVGVTRAGKVLLLNPFDRIVWHGHGLNGTDVGIEIDGHYEGIEGDLSTYWRPKGSDRLPLARSEPQIEAAREAVRLIYQEVAGAGGEIKRIHAHRQASDQRRSDPGSMLWKAIGLWAQEEFGLDDGGRGFRLGSGLAIPEAWDSRYDGVRY